MCFAIYLTNGTDKVSFYLVILVMTLGSALVCLCNFVAYITNNKELSRSLTGSVGDQRVANSRLNRRQSHCVVSLSKTQG